MKYRTTKAVAAAVGCCALIIACGDKSVQTESANTETSSPTVLVLADAESENQAVTTSIEPVPADQFGEDDTLSAILSTGDIPYPVYPNGSKYRIGGENGLKIVLFQTTDSFEAVDRYYQAQTDSANMPRLSAMNDYVRYTLDPTDTDPWGTSQPGIVIYEFDGDDERKAVGASMDAKTNIIMSF